MDNARSDDINQSLRYFIAIWPLKVFVLRNYEKGPMFYTCISLELN